MKFTNEFMGGGSWLMFNRISKTYDFLNGILSFGIDRCWRKSLAESIYARPGLKILDVAAGTGDQLLENLKYLGACVERAVGVDPAEKMLAIACRKTVPRNTLVTPEWVLGWAEELPFEDNEFDVVSITFGIRNTMDPYKSLCEMRRVLKNGGSIRILEFSLPPFTFVRELYLLYFRRVLPWIGGRFSGDYFAYLYLNQSVESFPQGDEFLEMLRGCGFVQPRFRLLTMGIVTLYLAEK
ncbi:MAG: ubiquinone/menaquinone biosynthesis methyltransferase [Chthoniobacterales bacterium]|nr:ubiquinone/menaquinone biosynthesis methyltransferase [Chthoniobacterales bacterium]